MVAGTIRLGIRYLSSAEQYEEIMQEVKGAREVAVRLRIMATIWLK